jgi:hypothetical protein
VQAAVEVTAEVLALPPLAAAQELALVLEGLEVQLLHREL